MTGLEIGFISVSVIGLCVSLSIAGVINMSYPEKTQVFVNRLKHDRRSKKYKHNIYVGLSQAQIIFSAICDFLTKEKGFTTNRNGYQYVQVTIYGVNYNFKIPETDTDIKVPIYDDFITINIKGEYAGTATGFQIYYDSKDTYDLFIGLHVKPFKMFIDNFN